MRGILHRRPTDLPAEPTPGLVPLRRRVIAPHRGWPGAGGGRCGHVERGAVYLGTSVQVAGLFPFVQAAGLPAQGVPLGPDLLTHELVCLDPPGWVGHLVSNPSVWVQGQPGSGKSSLVKRICLGLVGYGYAMLCPGDPKGEYAPLVEALGGQVVRVGRGLDRINPLDSGPIGRLVAARPAAERDRLAAEVNARRTELLAALLATTHGLGRRLSAEEAATLTGAVRLVAEAQAAEPVIPDVIGALRMAPATLMERLMCRDEAEFRAASRPVVAALENLCDGPLAGLFDGPTTRALDLAAPAVSVDLSSLLTAGAPVIAAGLLATWAYSYQAVDVARALGLDPRPRVLPLDEMWRALRAGPGLVDAFDAITRLNRAKGEVSLMVTHSLRDLDALPTEEDRAKAAGLMERCDTVILAAQPVGELERVAARKPLTDAELALVASWDAPALTGVDGTNQVHPGRGRYLIKLGQRVGVPVRLALTPDELALYDTDQAIRATAMLVGQS
jgi:hypothetical protein